MNDYLLSEFTKFVCGEKAAITLQLYFELSEVKRYYNISYSYNSELNDFILYASKQRNTPACAFLPIKIFQKLNFKKIQQVIKAINCRIIYLVIVHPDSTCVYYQIADGLVEPTDTTAKHVKENIQEKIDNELKKNRQLLEQGALMGLQITLKKDEN